MQAPVLVLNHTTKRESGRKTQLGNVAASKAVADLIRTTLGPKSMLKMILDPMGGIVLTNDGNAILREIDVSHPAAKSMIELSRTQDEEVGDGTTSVIVLAGEIMASAEVFLERNMHPTIILSAYHQALDEALNTLNRISFNVDTKDRSQMLAVVRSALGTKFVSRYGDMVCEMALQAVSYVTQDRVDGRQDIDIKRYVRVERIPGGEMSDCKVLDGIMVEKDVTHPCMNRSIKSPKILLLDSPLEYKKGESQTNVEISREEDWDAILKAEEESIVRMCDAIIKVQPTLVICEKGISDLASHLLMKAGISCVRRVKKSDCNRIALAVGATIVHRPEEAKPSDIGIGCGTFDIRKIGDNFFMYLVECKDPKACTVVLRGASKDVLQEMGRNLQDALMVAKNVTLDPRVVLGGGAAEMAVAQALVQKAKSVSGVQQWPFRAVASAFEIIPRTLIENCGGQAVRVLTELRAKHADGHQSWGVDGCTGQCRDMADSYIWDALAVKTQTVKTAIESASLLLRIDDIVSGLSAKK